MKVLYDYQIFLNQNYGGPSRYFYNLVKEVSKFQSVSICAPFHINNYLENLPKDNVDGFKIDNFFFNNSPHRFKELIKNKFLNKVNYYLQKKKISIFKPDLIHRTYFENYKTDLPVVLTVYDLIHEKFYESYDKKENYRPKKAAIDRADQIICISKNTLKDLNYYYDLKNKKTKVIYLASDLKNNKYNNEVDTSKKKNNYLLFVGKRTGYKNFIGLLKAYLISNKLIRDFKIICFGGGSLIRSEINLLNELKIPSDKVEFINGDDRKLISLYKNARALIYPSKYEGFGLPILEAMSFDCPVLCSNTSSIPEVGNDAVFYFDPESPENILDSILEVVYSDTKTNELKKKGRDRVKFFSWHNCATETLELYKQLV